MHEQHYSSPITAGRQWRGYDATANVFNDVNRRLCDDSVLCAGHVQQLGDESSLSSLMVAKD